MADQINAVLAQRTGLGGGKYTDFVAASEAGLANVFGPATPDAPGIQAAINMANLWGGGTVPLPAGPVNLSAELNLLSGVKLKGVPPQLVYNTIPDSGLTTLVGSAGGTVLTPSGAFRAITWNTAALGAPASQTAFSQAALTNVGVEDVGFSGANGGTWAIQAGATNNPSCWYSQFKNIYATGFTAGGGFSWTNYQHCQFDGNYTFGCQWGQLHAIDVASASLAPGNSTYKDLYNQIPTTNNINSRSISFITQATTGGAANNNEFKFDRIQSNRFNGVSSTQAATMVNTQTTFTVTDGTKFAVGAPVGFSATANGFNVNWVYFIASVAGNNVTVALTYGGAAIAATGATAVNIIAQGFPCFEMISLSGNTNTNVVIDNIDVEGVTGAGMFFQNCNGGTVNVSQVPGTGQGLQSIVCRGCANMIFNCPQSASTDWDNSAVGQVMGFFGARFGTSVRYMGFGMWYDTVSNTFQVSAGNTNDKQGAAGLSFNPAVSGGIWVPQNMGIGQATKFVNTAALAISELNCATSNATGASTNTLPAAAVGLLGCWFTLVNRSGSNQTLNTNGTDLFNGVATRTACTVPTGANCTALCVYTGSSSYGWDIVPSGAMVAGAVSAAS